MLCLDMNSLVTEGGLKKGNILKISAYTPNIVKGKRILILINVEILHEYGEQEKIGSPVELDKMEGGGQDQPAGVSANGFYGNRPAVKQESTPQRSMPSRPATGGDSIPNLCSSR